MSTNWPFVGTFIFGLLLQIALSINFVDDFKKNFLLILEAIGYSLFAFIPGKTESDYDLGFHLVLFCIIFCVCAATFFKNKIISTLNEKTLLILNLITLYLIVKSHFPLLIIVIYIFLSIPVIINALIPVRLKDWQEVAFYVWYFILTITLPIAHFKYAEVYSSFVGQNSSYSFVSALALGMAFCFILVNIMFLLRFFPYRDNKYESYAVAYERVRQHIKLLEQRYKNSEQLTSLGALLLIVVIVGLLALNYYINFIADSFLIIFILLFNSFTARYKTSYS